MYNWVVNEGHKSGYLGNKALKTDHKNIVFREQWNMPLLST